MTNGENRHTAGFSVIEILISMAITLVVLAMVFQITRLILQVYNTQSRVVELSSTMTRAFDDVTYELSHAGYGLGLDVVAVLPYRPLGDVSSDTITLRSNPEGLAANLLMELDKGGLAILT